MIPNNLHYIHLSDNGRQWKLHHHLSVLSAIRRSGVESVNIWIDTLPSGEWWERTEQLVNVHFIEPPVEIFNKPITQPAHKSDVLRLQILLEYGGIYVDTDTIFVRSYTELLNNDVVLGQQGINGCEGICPAVILAQPNAEFITQWLYGFDKYFKGGPPGSEGWCTHSVLLPSILVQQTNIPVTLMSHESFFWPLYHTGDIKMLFEQNHTFPNAYSHHLWESSGKHYLNALTIDNILSLDTTFTNLVKDLI